MRSRQRWLGMSCGLALLAAPAFADENLSYQYDSRGRLVQVSRSGTVNNGISACYAYDRGDNRKNVTVATTDCATLGVSASSVSATEGSPLVFIVNKIGGSSSSFTVNYATSNGTATAGSDYTAASGTLTFAAGETSKTVSVATTNDSTFEPDETVVFTLSNPSGGATLTDPQATGAILNNDGVMFSINDVSGSEADGAVMFVVTKTGTTSSSITISYATADDSATSATDYYATSGTLTFAASETTKNIIVSLRADTTIEAVERFKVNLSNAPSGASFSDPQGVATINDDD